MYYVHDRKIIIYIYTHTIHGRRIKSNSCRSVFFIEKHKKRERKKNQHRKKREKRTKTVQKKSYCNVFFPGLLKTAVIEKRTKTVQKKSYSNVFFPALLKTTVIEEPVAELFETVGIGNPITAFQHWRFINRCNRRPIVAVSKTAGIGSPVAAFSNRYYRLELLIFFFLIIFLFEKILSWHFKSVVIG